MQETLVPHCIRVIAPMKLLLAYFYWAFWYLFIHTLYQDPFFHRPNSVKDTFHITITPVDDQLPILATNVIKVQEGMKKVISQFEIEASDADTHDKLLVVKVKQPPQHGVLEVAGEQDAKVRYGISCICILYGTLQILFQESRKEACVVWFCSVSSTCSDASLRRWERYIIKKFNVLPHILHYNETSVVLMKWWRIFMTYKRNHYSSLRNCYSRLRNYNWCSFVYYWDSNINPLYW